MIVKDLIDLHYSIPFVIEGVEYTSHFTMPNDILNGVVDKIDVRQDPNDRTYKAYIDIYKVEDPT